MSSNTLQEQLGQVKARLHRDPSGIEGDDDDEDVSGEYQKKGTDSKGARRKKHHVRNGGFITDLQDADSFVKTLPATDTPEEYQTTTQQMGQDQIEAGYQPEQQDLSQNRPTPPQSSSQPPRSERKDWDGKDRRKQSGPKLSPCKMANGASTIEMELTEEERKILFNEIVKAQLALTKKERWHMAGQASQIGLALVGIAAGVLAIRRGLKASVSATE